MDWLWYMLLLVALVAGLALIVFTLPGIWLMIGATAIYGVLTHWLYVGLWTMLSLLALGVAAELLEFAAGSAGAKRAGGSRRAAWGALAGGLVGALFLSVPLPVIGTIVGACIGAFLGAMAAEFTVHGHTGRSIQVGVGAAEGRLMGTAVKLGFGLAVLAVVTIMALPLAGRRRRPLPAPTLPVALVSRAMIEGMGVA